MIFVEICKVHKWQIFSNIYLWSNWWNIKMLYNSQKKAKSDWKVIYQLRHKISNVWVKKSASFFVYSGILSMSQFWLFINRDSDHAWTAFVKTIVHKKNLQLQWVLQQFNFIITLIARFREKYFILLLISICCGIN